MAPFVPASSSTYTAYQQAERTQDISVVTSSFNGATSTCGEPTTCNVYYVNCYSSDCLRYHDEDLRAKLARLRWLQFINPQPQWWCRSVKNRRGSSWAPHRQNFERHIPAQRVSRKHPITPLVRECRNAIKNVGRSPRLLRSY